MVTVSYIRTWNRDIVKTGTGDQDVEVGQHSGKERGDKKGNDEP